MAIDSTMPRSRRAILVGAGGAAVASVISAAAGTGVVNAGDGDPVVVGGEYIAASVTKFDASGSMQTALWGVNDLRIGVQGTSTAHYGVWGSSSNSPGVGGTSTSSYGVQGDTSATDQPAVLGRASGNSTGVEGYSGTDTPAAAPAKTGVFGYANQDANAVGVKGQSVLGTGGLFTAGANGTSLRATGRVRFDKAAGLATVAAGTNGITVTPGIDLTSTSAVVATLQGIPSGAAVVKSVAVNTAANTFTIYLSANATHVTKVAWHVFG